MSFWTMVLVVSSVTAPPLTLGENLKELPTHVSVGAPGADQPNIKLDVQPQPWTKIDRLTGVETDVHIMVPTVTTIRFNSEKLCEAASDKLIKTRTTVTGATCIETD